MYEIYSVNLVWINHSFTEMKIYFIRDISEDNHRLKVVKEIMANIFYYVLGYQNSKNCAN